MTNIVDKINITILTILLIGLISYIIFLIIPIEVVEYHNPYVVLTTTVKQGKNLRFNRSFEKFIQVQGELGCYFQDGIIYYLPRTVGNNSVGVHNETVGIPIPTNLPAAKYTYHCVVTYKILGIKEVRREFYTEPFNVTE